MTIGTPTPNVPAAPDPMDDDQLADAGITTEEAHPRFSPRRLKLPPGTRTFLSNKKALFGFSLFLIIMLAAIFAPLLTSADPLSTDYEPYLPPNSQHPFGTT